MNTTWVCAADIAALPSVVAACCASRCVDGACCRFCANGEIGSLPCGLSAGALAVALFDVLPVGV